MEHTPISWKAPEFEHHEKEVMWSWISIMFAVIILTVAILGKNFLFAIFIIIAEMLILIWAHREPREITFEIDEKNIIIAEHEKHALKLLDHFGFVDINEEDAYIELGLAFNKFRPMIRILIPRELRKPVEQKLKLFGRRVDMEPTIVDSLQRIVRF